MKDSLKFPIQRQYFERQYTKYIRDVGNKRKVEGGGKGKVEGGGKG